MDDNNILEMLSVEEAILALEIAIRQMGGNAALNGAINLIASSD